MEIDPFVPFPLAFFQTLDFGGAFGAKKSQVDLERGESDVDDSLVPEILGGYYTTPSAPTEAPEKKTVELSQKKTSTFAR